MIANFPTPFADELIYSAIARCLWLMPTRDHPSAMRLLFGTPLVYGAVEMATNLKAISRSMGEQYDLHRLIRDHTLFPAYAPFASPNHAASIKQRMSGKNGRHARSDIDNRTIRPNPVLRFCPCCAAEERKVAGEAYWHRLHQLIGIHVCPVHRVFLENSQVARAQNAGHLKFIAAQVAVPDVGSRPIEAGNMEHETLIRLANGALLLLENSSQGQNFDVLRRRYLGHAFQLGYADPNGNIHWEKLISDFRRKYSESLLTLMQCRLPANAQRGCRSWLSAILKQAIGPQPAVRHLLLLDFFGITPSELLNTSPLKLSERGRLATQNKPSTPIAKPARIAPKEPLTEKTLKRRAARKKHRTEMIPKRRADWLAVQQAHPDLSTQEHIALAPRCFTFLFRYDRPWLRSTLPPSRRRCLPGHKSSTHELDLELSQEIGPVRNQLLTEQTGRGRCCISRSMILLRLGVFGDHKLRLDRMPLTKEALSKAIEC